MHNVSGGAKALAVPTLDELDDGGSLLGAQELLVPAARICRGGHTRPAECRRVALIADAPHCISQGMSARPCTAACTHPLLDGKPWKLLNMAQVPCPSSLERVQAPGVKREAQLRGVSEWATR